MIDVSVTDADQYAFVLCEIVASGSEEYFFVSSDGEYVVDGIRDRQISNFACLSVCLFVFVCLVYVYVICMVNSVCLSIFNNFNLCACVDWHTSGGTSIIILLRWRPNRGQDQIWEQSVCQILQIFYFSLDQNKSRSS